MKLKDLLSLGDFEDAARRVLPRPIFGYAEGSVETGASLRANFAAWDDFAFLPRMLVDTTARTQKATLFGRTYDAPFGIAPMGGTSMAAYQGDLVLARAAAQANIPMVMSGAALTPLEQVRSAGATSWFQAYVPGDDETINRLLERVERAGYDTLVVTCDVQVASNREHYIRTGFHTPLRPTLRLAWDSALRPRWLFGMLLRTLLIHGMPHFENMGPRVPLISRTGKRDPGRRDRLSWKHIDGIRRRWQGKLVLKGILDPADARRARALGVDGVIVSNHGGRQLDGAVAPLRVLPGIVAEAGAMTVMLDGGVRRGTHVLKALALGASFVFVGRPFFYAAAVGGQPGVAHAIRLLRDEIDRDMALLGITTLAEMTRDRVRPSNGSGSP
ncbi:MAG TPA: alpha-hydroxy acid oxidase [Burkholderiales bacterium]|nr:alpha-hydroxy acid oxidase [Burkholderiales bacterium]